MGRVHSSGCRAMTGRRPRGPALGPPRALAGQPAQGAEFRGRIGAHRRRGCVRRGPARGDSRLGAPSNRSRHRPPEAAALPQGRPPPAQPRLARPLPAQAQGRGCQAPPRAPPQPGSGAAQLWRFACRALRGLVTGSALRQRLPAGRLPPAATSPPICRSRAFVPALGATGLHLSPGRSFGRSSRPQEYACMRKGRHPVAVGTAAPVTRPPSGLRRSPACSRPSWCLLRRRSSPESLPRSLRCMPANFKLRLGTRCPGVFLCASPRSHRARHPCCTWSLMTPTPTASPSSRGASSFPSPPTSCSQWCP